jgi:hypothetical protein
MMHVNKKRDTLGEIVTHLGFSDYLVVDGTYNHFCR